MASRVTAIPKLRSRKDGAAVPLDDFDKRLLNEMQGSFPIVARPYAEVATALGVEESLVRITLFFRAAMAIALRASEDIFAMLLRHYSTFDS